jgi:COMPASS component SWD3
VTYYLTYGRLGSVRPGHSNRVFSIKFNPDDENILLSGGWDNTVQIWDIRAGASVRSIFGPHICGDAMDIYG